MKAEYDDLTQQLTNPDLISHWEQFQQISKRRAHLEKILKKTEELVALKKEIAENEDIAKSNEEDLALVAQQELPALEQRVQALTKAIEKMQQTEEYPKALIVELRAGTGGEEASLFAADLWNMYNKYAVANGWKVTVLNSSETEVNGIREISFEIEGEDAFENLQYEGGVHRVQRIPVTEKAGRIHTSTASVAILPKPSEAQIPINPSDIQVEFTTASGPGGQNVNKRHTAVRMTHIPTGLVVESQVSRSQQTNREYALALLRARLFEQREEKAQQELTSKRKAQIGWAKRAEKIRTYNFPQDRVTDHRIEQSFHGIEKITQGDLDPIIEALQTYQKQRESI